MLGLINEMEVNLANAKMIDDILRLEFENIKKSEYRADMGFKDAKLAITLKRFDNRSYDFFRSNGFFAKIDSQLQRRIDDLYWNFEAINRCVELYHYLKENKKERWDSDSIKNSDIILLYISEIEEIYSKEFKDQLQKIRFKI